MAKNVLDSRFQIRSDDSVSSLWRLWVTRPGDIYLAVRHMAGVSKYSFHISGICRSAFTSEHGTPPVLKDRAMFKWRRATTPPKGQLGYSRLLWLAVPTLFLTKVDKMPPADRIDVIPAAPESGATFVELVITAESETTVRDNFASGPRNLLHHVTLPKDETALLFWYFDKWDNKEMTVTGSGKVNDILLSPTRRAVGDGRVRVIFASPPKDGDALQVFELGGHPVAR